MSVGNVDVINSNVNSNPPSRRAASKTWKAPCGGYFVVVVAAIVVVMKRYRTEQDFAQCLPKRVKKINLLPSQRPI